MLLRVEEAIIADARAMDVGEEAGFFEQVESSLYIYALQCSALTLDVS